jgi:CRISPR/Cas system-associated exonuclease Cas4 (RecB family)
MSSQQDIIRRIRSVRNTEKITKAMELVAASRLRRDLQLALYALGAREALGLDPVDLEIVYLREGRRVVVPGGQDLISEARRVVGEVAEGVRAGHREPHPERRRCSLCPYRAVCDASLAL